jgi:hypothetical protein
MRELPHSLFGPPIALQKWGEGLVAGMVSEGGEVWVCAFGVGGLELGDVWLHAFCVGSVAATKSAKDKGSSRVFIGVFIWAKVGRKELCQGGELSWVSDERRDFELGDIGLRAVWRAELRGGAWDLSSCGEQWGMTEPRSLWGEVWFFWACGGDEA